MYKRKKFRSSLRCRYGRRLVCVPLAHGALFQKVVGSRGNAPGASRRTRKCRTGTGYFTGHAFYLHLLLSRDRRLGFDGGFIRDLSAGTPRLAGGSLVPNWHKIFRERQTAACLTHKKATCIHRRLFVLLVIFFSGLRQKQPAGRFRQKQRRLPSLSSRGGFRSV